MVWPSVAVGGGLGGVPASVTGAGGECPHARSVESVGIGRERRYWKEVRQEITYTCAPWCTGAVLVAPVHRRSPLALAVAVACAPGLLCLGTGQ